MSAPRTYLIPDLAVVTVAADVVGLVQDTIEFQLGYFLRPEAPTTTTSLPVISVRRYAGFTGGQGGVEFHGQSAGAGRFLNSATSRHVTCRTDTGFEVFSDSPEVLIILLLQTLALARGRTFLHAAGWAGADGTVTLLPGPGGVGKTALLSAAVLRHGVRLLGDDLVLIGTDGAAAFPRAFVLKEYHRGIFPEAFAAEEAGRRSRDRWRPFVKFLRENAPFHGLLKSVFGRAGRLESASSWLQARAVAPEFHAVPVTQLFGAGKVAAGGPVRRVIYMERHAGTDFRLLPLTVDEAVQRSIAVLHHEWADYLRWFSALGAVEVVDLASHFRQTEAAMRAAMAGPNVNLFQVPTGATPDELEKAFALRLGFGNEST